MPSHRSICATIIPAIIFSMPLVTGCHGSEETMEQTIPPPAAPVVTADSLQQEISRLKAERDSLAYKNKILDQFARDATARTSELESQLSNLKRGISFEPPPAPAAAGTRTAVTGDARETYSQGLELFRSGRYEDASAAFQSALDEGIEPTLQDNCNYWLGECAYGSKNYRAAIDHFSKVFTFKISEKKDDAQLMLANCYLALRDTAGARTEYEALLKKFPASPYVAKARAKLEKLR